MAKDELPPSILESLRQLRVVIDALERHLGTRRLVVRACSLCGNYPCSCDGGTEEGRA